MGDYIQNDETGRFEGSEPGGGSSESAFAAAAEPTSNAGVDAVTTYVGESGVLNEALRSNEPLSSVQQEQVSQLDAAIAAQYTTDTSSTLYRTVIPGDEQAPDVPNYDQMQPGTSFTDPGFVSTTESEAQAHEFSAMADNQGVQLLEIRAPEGSLGVHVSSLTGLPDPQSEVVLPRGSVFEVARQLSDRTIVSLVLSK
jgi:hypothetical protein